MGEIKTISPRQAAEKGASAMFIDVRTPAEFEEVHIDGAVLHPLRDLKAEVVKELTQHKSDCVVVCRSGGRAKQAFEKLAHTGVTGLCILEGGMTAWQGEGLPVVRGKKTISLERQVRIAAGSLVFIGSMLGYFVHPGFIALVGFVGAGLVFAGVTDTCGMAMMLAKMPWNTRAAGTSAAKGTMCTNPMVGGSSCSTKGN
jgi:rhodanese-related sulfurtransferase